MTVPLYCPDYKVNLKVVPSYRGKDLKKINLDRERENLSRPRLQNQKVRT
jgi:hypothetical protein